MEWKEVETKRYGNLTEHYFSRGSRFTEVVPYIPNMPAAKWYKPDDMPEECLVMKIEHRYEFAGFKERYDMEKETRKIFKRGLAEWEEVFVDRVFVAKYEKVAT